MPSTIWGPGSECGFILINVLYFKNFVFCVEFIRVLFLRLVGENMFQEV